MGSGVKVALLVLVKMHLSVTASAKGVLEASAIEVATMFVKAAPASAPALTKQEQIDHVLLAASAVCCQPAQEQKVKEQT